MLRFKWMIIPVLIALLCGMVALGEGVSTSQVADDADMIDAIDVVEPGMSPVTADMLNPGQYEVEVVSSSSMFKVASSLLIVSENDLSVQLNIASDSYMYLYAGTAQEASQAPEEALAVAEPLEDGGCTFALSIDALDAAVDCAAFSRRKQQWYPRTLLFRSDSLPIEAFRADSLVTVETLGLEDGEYAVRALLEGGSGKTQIEEATLKVEAGLATAVITFNTSKIDYVVVDGERFDALNADGNAMFEIPVPCFNQKFSILVDSTVMKPSREVDYTLVIELEE
ncbi:MAG: hypothetical protein IJ074_03930 [Clostridia bacterium]|nr:hypothetical protein [Clostridia bacterium]